MKKIILIALVTISQNAFSQEDLLTKFGNWFNSTVDQISNPNKPKAPPKPVEANPGSHLIFIGGGGEPAQNAVMNPPQFPSRLNPSALTQKLSGINEQSDPNHEGTIFDKTVGLVGDFTKRSGYQTTVSFNGGHTKTEEKLKESFKPSEQKGTFDKNNYDKIIDDYILKLQMKLKAQNNPDQKNIELPPLDKIMLFLDTHGAEKTEGSEAEITHKVSSANLNESLINLDKLKDLASLAEKTHTKLAILDMSCHSGNSLPLANSNTCVISSSGPIHYGYTSFSEKLAENLVPGKNLEEAFLSARQEMGGAGFPMISTPVGKKIQDAMYPLVTPYMYYHGEKLPNGALINKIDLYLEDASPNLICKREEDFKALMKLISDVEDIHAKEIGFWVFKTKVKTLDLTDLKRQLLEYKNIQDEYVKELASLNTPDMNREEEFNASARLDENDKNSQVVHLNPMKYTLKEIIHSDFNLSIANAEQDIAISTSDYHKAVSRANIELYKKGLKRQQELKADPAIARRVVLLDKMKTDYRLGRDRADSIATATQQAFDASYKKMMTEKTEEINPCRDFVI